MSFLVGVGSLFALEATSRLNWLRDLWLTPILASPTTINLSSLFRFPHQAGQSTARCQAQAWASPVALSLISWRAVVFDRMACVQLRRRTAALQPDLCSNRWSCRQAV